MKKQNSYHKKGKSENIKTIKRVKMFSIGKKFALFLIILILVAVLIFVAAAKFKGGGGAGACIQVITPAVSPSGECREFPTPCDVPLGWSKTGECPAKS